MGFSHAVHILMQINFRLISMALSSNRFLQAVADSKGTSNVTVDCVHQAFEADSNAFSHLETAPEGLSDALISATW